MRNSCKVIIFVYVCLIYLSNALGLDADDREFGYSDYAAVLKSYVDDVGMVNYKKLKTNSEKLEAFVTSMRQLNPNSYKKWGDEEKISFWLNAYNALTLKVIVDNYPIKHSFFKSMYYPKNSIRQIPGVWDKITFNVMGKDLTLKHIEHEILRKKFDEPRIHVAMVCAAIGCPPLRNEPYIGKRLSEQLNDQCKKFIGNPEKVKLDHEKKKVYLSPIFKWFADDFVNKYASEKNIAKHKKKTSAALNFIATYLNEADRDYILRGRFEVKYLKYDWLLNEQK